jgi:hypothetical protein
MPAGKKLYWSMALTNILRLTVKARFQAQWWSLELKMENLKVTIDH